MLLAATLVTVAALIASALAASVFYAFAVSVMVAFDRLPPQQAIDAMRTINQVIVNPAFFASFIGAILLLPAAAFLSWLAGLSTACALLTLASLLYAIGTFGVTAAANVPLNEALARLPAVSAEPASDWARFARPWNRWNIVRAVAATLSTLLAAFALLAMAR